MEYFKLNIYGIKLNLQSYSLRVEEEEAELAMIASLESKKEALRLARLDMNRRIEKHNETFYWYQIKQSEEQQDKITRMKKMFEKKNN